MLAAVADTSISGKPLWPRPGDFGPLPHLLFGSFTSSLTILPFPELVVVSHRTPLTKLSL